MWTSPPPAAACRSRYYPARQPTQHAPSHRALSVYRNAHDRCPTGSILAGADYPGMLR